MNAWRRVISVCGCRLQYRSSCAWRYRKIKTTFSPQLNSKSQKNRKQINVKQICKLSKINGVTWKLKHPDEGLFPWAVSFCSGLAVTLRRIKCCFVAAVSCPSPCLLLFILCSVQHVEGEIKVKATSTGSCSSRTLHEKHHITHTTQSHEDWFGGKKQKPRTHTDICPHAGVLFVLSVLYNDGWAWMWSTWRVITWSPVEASLSPNTYREIGSIMGWDTVTEWFTPSLHTGSAAHTQTANKHMPAHPPTHKTKCLPNYCGRLAQ